MDGLDSVIDWGAAADAELDDVVELRRAIHADPEIGLHCDRTTAKLRAAIAGLPLEIHDSKRPAASSRSCAAGATMAAPCCCAATWTRCRCRRTPACHFASQGAGRDARLRPRRAFAMLVGAARALCAAQGRAARHGRVHVPARRGGLSRRALHDRGRAARRSPRPEAAFALHISPNMPGRHVRQPPGRRCSPRPTRSTSRSRGRGGHAAMPHDALDPIPVACEIVTALQTFIARRVPSATPPCYHRPDHGRLGAQHRAARPCEMIGTLRTLSERTRELMRDALRRGSSSTSPPRTAGRRGARSRAAIPVTMNDPRAADLMRARRSALGGDGAWQPMPAPMMGAEDFSYVLREVPGAMAFIGVAAERHRPAHQPAAAQHEDDDRRGHHGPRRRPALRGRGEVSRRRVRLAGERYL